MSRPDLDITANMMVLEPYLSNLVAAVRRGFATYQNEYTPRVKAAHDNAAAAKCVHRHILEEVEFAIDGLGGLALVNARGLMVLNVHDRALLRFKKMDEEGHSASYPTQQAKSFDRQLPLPNLPPSATRLTFGYEPDLAFSEIVRLLTACPLGPRTLWCAQITEEVPGTATWTDITPLRFAGTEPFRHYGTGNV